MPAPRGPTICLHAFRGKAVALDIACGLRFLHTAKPNPILHLDLVSCELSLLVAACVSLLRRVGACVSAMLPMRLCCVWSSPHMNAPDTHSSLPVKGRPCLVCPPAPDHSLPQA